MFAGTELVAVELLGTELEIVELIEIELVVVGKRVGLFDRELELFQWCVAFEWDFV